MFLYTSWPASKRCCSSGVSGAIGAAAPGLPGHSIRARTFAARGPSPSSSPPAPERRRLFAQARRTTPVTGGGAWHLRKRVRAARAPRAPGHVGHGGAATVCTASTAAGVPGIAAPSSATSAPRISADRCQSGRVRIRHGSEEVLDRRRPGPVRTIVAAIIVIAASRCGVCSVVLAAGFAGRPLRCPRTPLSAASSTIGSSACALEQRHDRAFARRPAGSAPSDAASCSRTLQSGSSSRFSTAAWIGGVRLSQPSLREAKRRHAHVARRIVERLDHRRRLDARRCRRASTARAAASAAPSRSSASSRQRRARPTRSPRSTSSRCAVSRHQPFGCDSSLDQLRRRRRRQRRRRVAARRLVHDAVDAAEAGRLLELVREDVIAQVLGDVGALLDDAAIHVDDVERAVGRVRQIRPAGSARRSTRGTLPARTPCAPAASSRRRSRTMRLTRLAAGSATNTLPYSSAGRRSPR